MSSSISYLADVERIVFALRSVGYTLCEAQTFGSFRKSAHGLLGHASCQSDVSKSRSCEFDESKEQKVRRSYLSVAEPSGAPWRDSSLASVMRNCVRDTDFGGVASRAAGEERL